jgi:hypothetical protein
MSRHGRGVNELELAQRRKTSRQSLGNSLEKYLSACGTERITFRYVRRRRLRGSRDEQMIGAVLVTAMSFPVEHELPHAEGKAQYRRRLSAAGERMRERERFDTELARMGAYRGRSSLPERPTKPLARVSTLFCSRPINVHDPSCVGGLCRANVSNP